MTDWKMTHKVVAEFRGLGNGGLENYLDKLVT